MEGIEKITAKIAQDAQDEVRRVREEAQAQAQAILAQAQAQADQERDAILTRGRRAADERLERLSSAAGMERRKLELAARQEVLGEAFDLALEKLCALPEEEYVALLTQLVLKASSTGRQSTSRPYLSLSSSRTAPLGRPSLPSPIWQSSCSALSNS